MAESLGQRVLTAVVMAAVLLGVVLWLAPWVTVAVLTLLALAGAWEWSRFLQRDATLWRIVYVVLVAALLWLAWRLTATTAQRNLLLGLAVLWWLVALAWIRRGFFRTSFLSSLISVAVGGASDDLPLAGSFTLTGPVRRVDAGRVLTTPVSVRTLSTEEL